MRLEPLNKWVMQIAQMVAQIDNSAFITGESFYVPFFNGLFGPTMEAVETEVLVLGSGNANQLQFQLDDQFPSIRWHVTEIDGNSLADLRRYLQTNPLIAQCGAMRLSDNHLELVFGYEVTYAHVTSGLLEPSPYASNEPSLEATRLIARYPGLSAPFLSYHGEKIEHNWQVIEQKVHLREFGGRVYPSPLAPKEAHLADQILHWHCQASKHPELVPIPSKSSLPAGNPWDATDSEFREWLLDQTLSKYRKTRPDPYLQHVLQTQSQSEQKPTHQGWKVYQHAIMSSLMLTTDSVRPEHRRLLRLATLWHDVGKANNIWTPGAHGAFGAKIWSKHKPDWITEEEASIVYFLIQTHDYLGLMDRYIKDPAFRGGLSPTVVRLRLSEHVSDLGYALRLNSTIYQADISSVSTLRWLIPLTPLLEQLVLAET